MALSRYLYEIKTGIVTNHQPLLTHYYVPHRLLESQHFLRQNWIRMLPFGWSSVAKTDNNRVTCDTSRPDEETSTFIRNQVSVNSDSVSFMHHSLISCGVTDTKSVPNIRHQLFKRLHKLTKLFGKNSRSKVQKYS